MKKAWTVVPLLILATPGIAQAFEAAGAHDAVSPEVIKAQQEALIKNMEGKGFGPQSPRDLGSKTGNNARLFATAPAASQMNLCNIHFHKNAEHKGGEFTEYAGPGDGHGFQTGFRYRGKLSAAELKPTEQPACMSEHGGLMPGDTIELHYVHSSAQITPGPTLGACLSESISNPQLRVEAQVLVLTNDGKGADFAKLAEVAQRGGYHQAINLPQNSGKPVEYAGSTTGPAYNEKGSPLQVSWRVRPKVIKVDAASVGKWCSDNIFKEDHAHGVRNLVTDAGMLSPIK